MNSYKHLFHSAILFGSLGFATLLVGTPSCKAQEISPDHFTSTGVQNVSENAAIPPVKVAPWGAEQKKISLQARNHRSPIRAARKTRGRVDQKLVAQSRQ